MKKTIQILIASALLTMTYSSYCQCTTSVDEMTKDKIVSTELKKIGSGQNGGLLSPTCFFKMAVSKINDIPYFGIYAERNSASTIDANDIIYIKTQDSVLKIINPQIQITKVKSGQAFSQGTNNIMYYYALTIQVDKQTLEYIKNHPVSKIRVDNIDYEIDRPEILTGQINCILDSK